MEYAIHIRIFNWKDRWHVAADRVFPTVGRRVATRQRVWETTLEGQGELTEYDVISLAAEALDGLMRRG